jgi:choline dehydrogenase-like flavoprotein
MASADVIVVGSGPSGTFAAYQLRGRDVLVLDVGNRGDPNAPARNLYDLRKTPAGVDLFAELIGARFESLHNIFHASISPKLKSPRLQFVTSDANVLSPVSAGTVDHVVSLAAGGMANAWGGGMYPFNEDDLNGYPIDLTDLEPYYSAVTAKVGICGADDDLSRFFGTAAGLQRPLELPSVGSTLLKRYTKRRATLNRRGLYIGRPRLAVLTHDHDGRQPYHYEALEFFRPNQDGIYNPAHTLDEMVRDRQIRYQSGVLVERYTETDEGITVSAHDRATGQARSFRCRRLILAAGTLNTTRIVLSSNRDYSTRLPLLDTPMTYMPLLDPTNIGGPLDKARYSAAMLSAVYTGESAARPFQITMYTALGTLRSDFLYEFPWSARGNIAAAKYLTPALLIAQVTHPDDRASICVGLSRDGQLELEKEDRPIPAPKTDLLRLFRRLGYFGSTRFCRNLKPGSSYRFAGTLPMTTAPIGRYQTDRQCRLSGTQSVYIADAATFSPLPAKNHSFTMMANAMRVAEHVRTTL